MRRHLATGSNKRGRATHAIRPAGVDGDQKVFGLSE